MSQTDSKPQLRMVWPEHLLNNPPAVQLPVGYTLRTYKPGDEPRFYKIMELAGWPEWDDERLQPWLAKVIPNGWFMVLEEQAKTIVATAMGLHNYKGHTPFWGNLGWLACDPAHTGHGLGLAVSAAVIARFIEAGYKNIDLYTEDFRLPALKTYLKLGYVPDLYQPEMIKRWAAICKQIQWPVTPERWLF